MNTLSAVLSLCGVLVYFTGQVCCTQGSLIANFTVNGGSSVTLAVGDAITFIAYKRDGVRDPVWSFYAQSLGKYIFGGLSMNTKSVIWGTTATCEMNGVVVCQATSDSTTDTKTVTVTITSHCTNRGSILQTTPKNSAYIHQMSHIATWIFTIVSTFFLADKINVFM